MLYNIPRYYTSIDAIDILPLMIEFYASQLLEVSVSRDFGDNYFLPSVEKLIDDVHEYCTEFNNKFARMIYDYTILAIISELRYVGSEQHFYETKTWKIYHMRLPWGLIDEKNYILPISRFLATEARKFNDKKVIELAKFCFNETMNNYWNSNFGGNSWYEITKLMESYGKIPNEVFIDRCIDMQHNSGTYFDKEKTNILSLGNNDPNDIERFLDYKFKVKDIYDFIFDEIANNKEYYKFTSLRLKTLYKRWWGLCKGFNINKDFRNSSTSTEFKPDLLDHQHVMNHLKLFNPKNTQPHYLIPFYLFDQYQPIKWGTEDPYTPFYKKCKEKETKIRRRENYPEEWEVDDFDI